jgi:PAS domain S-box-containing protein
MEGSMTRTGPLAAVAADDLDGTGSRALLDAARLRDRLTQLIGDLDGALAACDVDLASAALAEAQQVAPGSLGLGSHERFLNGPLGQATIDPSGTVHVANAGVIRLLRLPRERVVGHSLAGVLVRGARPQWFEMLHKVFGGGERVVLEVPLAASPIAGTEVGSRWIRVAASPLPGPPGASPKATVLFWDVSEERAALARLRQSEAGFRSLIERLPEAVIVHRNGQVGYANPSAARCFGVAAAVELVGERVEQLVHPEDMTECRTAWLAASRETAAPTPRHVRMRRADRGWWVAEVADLSVLFDGDWSVVTLARDLTEQRALQARLMLTDRLSNMGTLAAGLAHEINNPLQYMTANTQVVRADLAELAVELRAGTVRNEKAALRLEEAGVCLSDVAAGEQRVGELVRELRGFSRVSDRQVPVDVAAVVKAALRVVGNELHFRARVVVDLPDTMPRVMADEGRLFQVFLNLLVNAAQAIPAGDADAHRVQVTTETVGQQVIVRVSDTGCGMDMDQAAHIFEPFYTTKDVGEGTGLGLAICASIVRGIGGDIEVASRPGEGSVFSVRLPVDPREKTQQGEAASAPVRRVSARCRVLVVDDEPAIRKALSRALGTRHEVVGAGSARDAVALLEDDDAFDLVLSDVLMDRGGGPELHDWLEAHRPALRERLVFMTGGAFMPRAAAFVEKVDRPVLDKPIRVDDVERILVGLMDKSD